MKFVHAKKKTYRAFTINKKKRNTEQKIRENLPILFIFAEF